MSNLSNFVRKQIFSERGNVFISHNFQLQPIHTYISYHGLICSSKWNLFVGSSSGLHHCRESIFKSTFSRKDSKLILFLWSDQFDADSIFYMTCIFHRQYILQMDKTTAKGQIFPFSSPRLSATTTRDKMGTRLLYFAARFNFVPFFWFLKFFFLTIFGPKLL